MAGLETGHDSEINFESALENYLNPDFGDLEEGSITKGEIVRVDDDTVLVDVNFKSEGQIPAAEFRDPAGNMTVKVGDKVKRGQTLCIVEAMKLMNEIMAEVDGEIVEICVANGQVVDYGSPLFRIRER